MPIWAGPCRGGLALGVPLLIEVIRAALVDGCDVDRHRLAGVGRSGICGEPTRCGWRFWGRSLSWSPVRRCWESGWAAVWEPTVAAMGVLALLGGGWRMLSEDYGPALSVNSALLFLMATAHSGSFSEGVHLTGLVALGGLGAALLQIVFWLFRPQHSLRYAVAECWVAVSDLATGMRQNLATGHPSQDAMTGTGTNAAGDAGSHLLVILGSPPRRETSSRGVHYPPRGDTRRGGCIFAMRLLASGDIP